MQIARRDVSQITDEVRAWYAGFSLHVGDNVKDPLWNKDFYRMFKHDQEDESYLYVSLEDNAVQFVRLADYIIHFPNRLKNEGAVTTPDFDFEMAPCTHTTNHTFSSL